ncbi:MAG: hypothetical protein HY720_13595 [Planctomycetes bacterium]|nr:hypothetical protein [Planctomycetota bacterium]
MGFRERQKGLGLGVELRHRLPDLLPGAESLEDLWTVVLGGVGRRREPVAHEVFGLPEPVRDVRGDLGTVRLGNPLVRVELAHAGEKLREVLSPFLGKPLPEHRGVLLGLVERGVRLLHQARRCEARTRRDIGLPPVLLRLGHLTVSSCKRTGGVAGAQEPGKGPPW